MTRDLTTDSNRLIREEDGEINTNLARTNFLHEIFHLPVSSFPEPVEIFETRGEGCRVYDTIRGRVKKRDVFVCVCVCVCSANGNVDRVLIWGRDGGVKPVCSTHFVQIQSAGRGAAKWTAIRFIDVENAFPLLRPSISIHHLARGCCPRERGRKEGGGAESKHFLPTEPPSSWNLVHFHPFPYLLFSSSTTKNQAQGDEGSR